MDNEWKTGPLPEGAPGARIENEHGVVLFAMDGGWSDPMRTRYRAGDLFQRWRWLQKPGELEELRERAWELNNPDDTGAALLRTLRELDEDEVLDNVYDLDTDGDHELPLEAAVIAWRKQDRPLSVPHDHLERIVGEVQQALAGKPAEECVTDEGQAVAELYDLAIVEARKDGGNQEPLMVAQTLAAQEGWTP